MVKELKSTYESENQFKRYDRHEKFNKIFSKAWQI